MMFVVAITCPFICGATMVAELASELSEVVELNAVTPESWLALGILVTLIADLCNRATPSEEASKTGAVFVLKSGAYAIIRVCCRGAQTAGTRREPVSDLGAASTCL